MYLLKEFQEQAVGELLSKTIESLNEPGNQLQILLEAPTGAGKTVMMASFLERLVETPNNNNQLAFIWFAPNTLHIQSFHSLQKMYANNSKLNCIDLSNLTGSPSLNPKDLLFVNWSKVSSDGNIWRQDNENNTNLESLIENTKNAGIQIILIIDEAHLAAFTGNQAIAVRNLLKAKIEISVTATPRNRPAKSINISRHKVIGEGMIKKGVRLNIGLDPEKQNNDNVHVHLLRTAFEKKEELQRLYDAELGKDVINPLLIIQLPTDSNTISEDDKSIRDTIIGLLNSNDYNISTANGRLAIWLSGERDTDGLEAMNGLQDVLIFKQAIAQGWDCPRASILVSYRKVNDYNFGIQTVGRILRMPHQKHYHTDELNYGYVYTNIQNNQITFVPTENDYFENQLAQRKQDKNLIFDKLTTATMVNDRASVGALTSHFEKVFFDFMEQKYEVIELPEVDFYSEKGIDDIKNEIESNRKKFIEKLWTFEIDDHKIKIFAEKDGIDPYNTTSIALQDTQMQRFAITTSQFSELFEHFCYDSVTRLNKSKSWKRLRDTLIHFAEYYLGIGEYETHRLLLYPQNKGFLIQDIASALEQFDEWQTANGNKNRRLETEEWEVPKLRYYSKIYNPQSANFHALEPYYEFLHSDSGSNPEMLFRKYLEENSQYIQWWYKNGDKGKEHFAIPYTTNEGNVKLFYIDFVIKFNSGKIGLFDTKASESDPEATDKHNALLKYMKKENRDFVGGIVIPKFTGEVVSWRFPNFDISNTFDLTGWDYFNPAEM